MSYIVNKIAYPGVTSVLGIKDKGTGIIQWAVNCGLNNVLSATKTAFSITYLDNRYIDENNIKDAVENSRTAWKTTRDNTADLGTKLHDLVEKFIKLKLNHYTESWIEQKEMEAKFLKNIQKYQPYNLKQMFYQFFLWQNKHVKKFLKSEQTIVHEDLCYAGTVDFVYIDHEDNICLYDLKTKNALYGEERDQVAAYMYAMNNMTEKKYKVRTRSGNEFIFIHKPIKVDKCGVLMISRDYFDCQHFDYTKKAESRFNAFCKLLDFFYADKKRRLINNPRVKECL
jgi:hypothetical protein